MNIDINENQLEIARNKRGNNNIENNLSNYKLLEIKDDIKIYQYSNNNYKSPYNLIYQYYIDEFELNDEKNVKLYYLLEKLEMERLQQ